MSQFTYLHINTVYVGIFLVESIQKNDNYNTNTKNNNNNSSSSSLRKKKTKEEDTSYSSLWI